jgi:hypothetical protein
MRSAQELRASFDREDPVGVRKAVARILRDVTRYTSQVLMPPGWDASYLTVFSYTLDTVGVQELTSMTSKLRSAGLASRPCPARRCCPPACQRWRSPSVAERLPRPA